MNIKLLIGISIVIISIGILAVILVDNSDIPTDLEIENMEDEGRIVNRSIVVSINPGFNSPP